RELAGPAGHVDPGVLAAAADLVRAVTARIVGVQAEAERRVDRRRRGGAEDPVEEPVGEVGTQWHVTLSLRVWGRPTLADVPVCAGCLSDAHSSAGVTGRPSRRHQRRMTSPSPVMSPFQVRVTYPPTWPSTRLPS